jgi:hypothetical protein
MTQKIVDGVYRDMTPAEEARKLVNQAKAEAGAFDGAIANLRQIRNTLLAETDFYALSDVTMSEDVTNYRQQLRDLPSGLTTVEEVQAVTFPTKP